MLIPPPDCSCGHPGLRHYALGHMRNAGPCKERVCPCRHYDARLTIQRA